MQRGFSLIELVIVLAVVASTSLILSYTRIEHVPKTLPEQCHFTEQEAQRKVMEQLYYDASTEFCP